MMVAVKEKNLIKFVDGEVIRGSIDINTGIIYGVRGNPVKSLSSEAVSAIGHSSNQLMNIFNFGIMSNTRTRLYYKMRNGVLLKVDKIVNAGCDCDFDGADDLSNEEIEKYLRNKDYRAYIAEQHNHYFSHYTIHQYERKKTLESMEKTLSSLPNYAENSVFITNLLGSCENDIKYCCFVLTHVIAREDYHFHSICPTVRCGSILEAKRYDSDWLQFLSNYYRLTKALKRGWDKKNIFADYNRCLWLWQAERIAYETERFQKHTDASVLSFEYGNYEIVVPTCGNDLIVEGQRMHHCVGGYVENVVRGYCAIVFVRNKSALDTPYITCEITIRNGMAGIKQYYLAYDRTIHEQADYDFRYKYEEYLLKHSDEIIAMLQQ